MYVARGLGPTALISMRDKGTDRLPITTCSISHPLNCTCAAHAQARILRQALSAPPTSLFYERGGVPIPNMFSNSWGKALLTLLGFYSHKSTLLHGEWWGTHGWGGWGWGWGT